MRPSRFDALARLMGSSATRRGALWQLGVGGLGGTLLGQGRHQQATPLAAHAPGCTSHNCRCNGGTQNLCDDPLICCADNPGLPGGPGRCIHPQRCNLTNCTEEGCDCHSGSQDACDDGLVCCGDDSSMPGGPGRCEQESVCFATQCQATTNPCASDCDPDTGCSSCCSGYCGPDGHCDTPVCSGTGCECQEGMQGSKCDEGLTCCPSSNQAGGPGICTAGACS